MTTTVKLDYTKWRELKAVIYDALEGTDHEYRTMTTDKVMELLENKKIIKFRDTSDDDDDPKQKKEPKPPNYDKGKYKVEQPLAKLSCGCIFDYSNATNDDYCNYHSGESGIK